MAVSDPEAWVKHALEDAATDMVARNFGEQSLDEIEP